MGARMMQAQATVETVVVMVVVVLLDGKGNLGWWRKTPSKSKQ